MPVSQITINLDRPSGLFYAGEVVRGTVTFQVTGSDVTCRGAHIRFQGKSRIHWHTGSGDDRRDYDGTTMFVSQRQTLYGNFYKTALLDNAGADAIFGKVHGDGVVLIPCTTQESQTSLNMALRVMDYDWGKRDDLLGEQVVDLVEISKRREKMQFDLTRFGKPEKGQVEISCKFVPKESLFDTSKTTRLPTEENYDRICVVTIHSATGLRKADWAGKNDVYVQLYRLAPDASRRFRNQLPQPDKNTTIPTGDHTIGFAFVIPSHCPGSAELQVSDYAYVRYDLYANVDIKMRKDPSRKIAISVISNRPAPTMPLLGPATAECLDQPLYGCNCCGRCCKKDGLVSAVVQIDRRAYAPGETIDVRRSYVSNDTSKALPVLVELRQYIAMSTGRSNTSRTKTFQLAEGTVPANGRLNISSLIQQAKIPVVFPSFDGGLNGEPEDYPRRYTSLKWSYAFTVSMSPDGCCPSEALAAVPILITSAPPFPTAISEGSNQAEVRVTPEMNAFSALSYAVFGNTPTALMPYISGPEDGGLPTAANGLEGGVITYEPEDNGNIGASNPPYVPMVNAFATNDTIAVVEDNTPHIPTAPTTTEGAGAPSAQFGTLLNEMKDSYDKRQVVGEWIRDNPGEAGGLTPSQVGQILSQVTFSLDQPTVAGEIVAGFERYSTLTCAHIAAAMDACGFQKMEVAKIMVPFATDPHNKSLVLEKIDYEFEKNDVSRLFQSV